MTGVQDMLLERRAVRDLMPLVNGRALQVGTVRRGASLLQSAPHTDQREEKEWNKVVMRFGHCHCPLAQYFCVQRSGPSGASELNKSLKNVSY